MNAKELAQSLNGREYGRELIPREVTEQARRDGLVIVYGASDDLVEMEGAINDEFGFGPIYLTPEGLLKDECENESCPYYAEATKKAAVIEGIWHDEKRNDYCWTFKASFPVEPFDVMEDGEKFCQGVIFALADVV
jgi:hypothetical protein